MANLGTLRREAGAAARARGHSLAWAAPWHGEYSSIQRGTCTVCGAEVDVTTRPMPNEIDIGGEAVATNCTGKEGGETGAE